MPPFFLWGNQTECYSGEGNTTRTDLQQARLDAAPAPE